MSFKQNLPLSQVSKGEILQHTSLKVNRYAVDDKPQFSHVYS